MGMAQNRIIRKVRLTGPRLLDVTRLVRRAGRVMTGVDRVEYAYLCALLDQSGPVFGLFRSSVGYVLLDREGCILFRDAVRSDLWPEPDWIGRSRKLSRQQAGAEALLRRACIARCLPHRLSRMLKRYLPSGIHYINVGHTNLTDRVVHAIKQVHAAEIAVLIHDTIPLDFPQFQRRGSPDRFRTFLQRAAQHADLLICISKDTQNAVARHVTHPPPMITAHLGHTPVTPAPAPKGTWKAPYFVVLGTIEPRKNHKLLLDIWPDIDDAHLLICGSRGWENSDVFQQLDARPDRVHELPNLTDPQVHGLIKGAAGLLFPSYAEGYGLPPVEAAHLGTPVICNDLTVCREILGDFPVYAPIADPYTWTKAINDLMSVNPGPRKQFKTPQWDAHFDIVFSKI